MRGQIEPMSGDDYVPCVECARGIPRARFIDGKVACPWCQAVQDDAGGQVVVSPLPVGTMHPKVTQRIEGAEQVYVTRQGSWFGWKLPKQRGYNHKRSSAYAVYWRHF